MMPPDEKNLQPSVPPKKEKDVTETFHHFAQDYPPGSLLTPRYRVLKLLGVGGMGRVYLAHDSDLEIDVALKIIRPELMVDDTIVHRFKNELVLARKVSHKNVVRIHDIGETDQLKYLSMTYIEGRSLRDLLRQSAPLPIERALALFTQICEGVAAAHEEGVVHRDLKPSNILLDQNDRVYVTDFGLARSLESADLTMSGSIVGTPAYFSPEQARGQTAHAGSDIYVLGLIFFEILTGELPYDRDSVDLFRTSGPIHLENKLKKHQPAIPPYLVALIRKCLQPNPEFRYRTVRALLEDLRNQQVKSPRYVDKRYRYAAAAFVVVAIALAFFWINSNNQKRSETSTLPSQAVVSAPSIAVLPFANKTGKQDMEWVESAAGDLLITGLSNSGNLRVVSSDRVFQTLQDLKIEPEMDAKQMKKVAEILDTDFVIQGSFTQAGSIFRADVKMTDVKTHSNPIHLKSTGAKQEDVFAMIDELALQIQRNLQTAPAAPASVSAIPLATLKSFEQGNDSFRNGDYAKSVEFYETSIRETPQFARGYLRLSEAHDRLGEPEKAIQTLEQAAQISNVDARTNYLIRAQHARISGDLDKTIDVFREINAKYPNDPDVLFDLAMVFEEKGDLKNAVESLQKLVKQDPNHPQAFFHLGKDTILMGDAEKAISQYLLKALSIHTQLNDQRGEADVLNAMGVAYERLGRYDDAIRYYNDSIAVKEKIGNKKGVATSLNNIAKIYVFQGEYDKAQEVLNRTLKIFEELQDVQGIAGAMNMFGVIHEDRGNYAEALRYYKDALKYRKELGNDQQTAQSYDNIGQIYYLLGQNDNAQVYWEQALSLRKAIGEESGLILSLQNLGFLQVAQGRLDNALKSFLEALDRSRAIKYENAIAVSLGNLGTVYQIQGRYAAAEDSYAQAIQILEKLKDKKGVAEYTKLLGSVFLELNNFPKAKTTLDNVYHMAQEIGSTEILTDVLILLGHGSRLAGKYDEAHKQLDEALRNATKFGYQRALVRGRIEQGWLWAAEDKPEDARTVLSTALKASKELSDARLIIESNYALASLAIAAGDHRGAIQLCENAIGPSKKMEARPYLFRLYSVAGEAYLRLHQNDKAMEYFRKGASLVEEIKKAAKPEQVSDFTKMPEVQTINAQLK